MEFLKEKWNALVRWWYRISYPVQYAIIYRDMAIRHEALRLQYAEWRDWDEEAYHLRRVAKYNRLADLIDPR